MPGNQEQGYYREGYYNWKDIKGKELKVICGLEGVSHLNEYGEEDDAKENMESR